MEEDGRDSAGKKIATARVNTWTERQKQAGCWRREEGEQKKSERHIIWLKCRQNTLSVQWKAFLNQRHPTCLLTHPQL